MWLDAGQAHRRQEGGGGLCVRVLRFAAGSRRSGRPVPSGRPAGGSSAYRDGELKTVRLKVNMLSATHQQLDGQMGVLRGNVENNNANISRIEEELKGQEDRSGGIVSQIDQTKARIEEIEAALTEKLPGSWTNCSTSSPP